MEVPVCRFYLCLLVLVTLACHCQGQHTTEEPYLLNKIKETLTNVKEKFDEVPWGKRFHIFDPPWARETTTTTTTTTTATTDAAPEDSTAEGFEVMNRNFISVPVRCPAGHVNVKGTCRVIQN